MGSDQSFGRLTWPGAVAMGVVSAISYVSWAPSPRLHRGMPSSWLTLILTLDVPLVLRGSVRAPEPNGPAWDAAPGEVFTSCVGGLHDRAAAVEMSGRQTGVQLSLDPLAAHRLLGSPAAALGMVEDAEAVLGPTVHRLRAQLAEAGTNQDRGTVLREWISHNQDDRHQVRAEVAHAWRLIQARRGDCLVEQIAAAVSLSPRQLRTLMRRELGIGPKQACRLARLDHAVARIVDGTDTSLAGTAAAAGYADHAHLDAEFRVMVGCSPSAWLAEERRNIQDGGHHNRPDSVP